MKYHENPYSGVKLFLAVGQTVGHEKANNLFSQFRKCMQ
jgi:hypothetical protein